MSNQKAHITYEDTTDPVDEGDCLRQGASLTPYSLTLTLSPKLAKHSYRHQIAKTLKRVQKFMEDTDCIRHYRYTMELTERLTIHYQCEVIINPKYEIELKSSLNTLKSKYFGFNYLTQIRTQKHLKVMETYLLKSDDRGFHALQKRLFGTIIIQDEITKHSIYKKLKIASDQLYPQPVEGANNDYRCKHNLHPQECEHCNPPV